MLDCYCDYDPPDFCTITKPTARKSHRCYECGGPITPGEKYEYVSGKWDGFLSQFHTCERCCDIRQWVLNNVPCFCWAHGNMIDEAREAVDEACARAPAETVGLRFGLLRRIALRDRFNRLPSQERSDGR